MVQPISQSSSSASSPSSDDPIANVDEVVRKKFATVRKGFDPAEVQSYLSQVAAALADTRRREADLRSRLGKAVRRADQAENLGESELVQRLGDEVTKVLQAAHEAARARIEQATADADALVSGAEATSTRLEQKAQTILDERSTEADAAAKEILDRANSEADATRGEAQDAITQAQQVAVARLDAARLEGESLIKQAEAGRAQVLLDMDRRRRAMRAQVELLKAGRDRLLQSHDALRALLGEIGNELQVSVAEAKIKGENAERRAADSLLATTDQLEAEMADAALIGTVELPEVERVPPLDADTLPEALGNAVRARADAQAGVTNPPPEATKPPPAAEAPKPKPAVEALKPELETPPVASKPAAASEVTTPPVGASGVKTPPVVVKPVASKPEAAPELTTPPGAPGPAVPKPVGASEVKTPPVVAKPQAARPEVAKPPVAKPNTPSPEEVAKTVDLGAEPPRWLSVVETPTKPGQSAAPSAKPTARPPEAPMERPKHQPPSRRVNLGTMAPAAPRKPAASQKPTAKIPVPTPAAKAPTPAPAAKAPTPAPAATAPTPSPVAKAPTPAPAAKAPTPSPVAKAPTPPAPVKAPTPSPVVKAPTPAAPVKAQAPTPAAPPAPAVNKPEPQPNKPEPQAKKPASAVKKAAGIDSLFANLRQPEPPATAPPAPVAPSTAAHAEATIDEDGLDQGDTGCAQARDAATAEFETTVERHIKRVLADEQNAVLQWLGENKPTRRRKTRPPVLESVGDEDAQVATYLDAIRDELASAYEAGATFADAKATGASKAALMDAEAIIRTRIVAPIRARLGAIADDVDTDEVATIVSGFYRGHKTGQLGDVTNWLTLRTFSHGTVGSMPKSAEIRWAFHEHNGGCPDGYDNSLGGNVTVGSAFPSGDVIAPLNPACRCLLVPGDR